jgi:PAS domain S-box-containing protein
MSGSSNSPAPDTGLFGDAFRASPIGIAVETFEGQPLFVNPALCAMLGFTEAELRNKHCQDFSPPEDAQRDWALFQQLREGSIDRYQLEKRYFRKDGSLVWGRLSLSLLKGRPSPLVLAMVEDITELKRAEEARFRHTAIVESSEDAIISKDLDGIIVSWNAGAHRIFGYTEAEVVGRPITILIPPALHEEESRILEELRAGKHIDRYETVRVTKAGKKVDVSLSISGIKDSVGRVVGYCKIAHDITERKMAERSLLALNKTLKEQAALLESREELLKIFVQNAPAGVAMFDRDMRYLQVSDRWCADYSIDSAQVLGRSHYELFPDIPHRWKEMHRRGLEGETLRVDDDCWNRQDGTKWVCWEIRPWWNLDRTPGGILIFAEDVTKRKEMELALSDVARRLVEAQEKERARIARDLHDDINQKLALLSMEVSQLEANPSEIEPRGQEVRIRIGEISADIHALAQDLHPSNLEYLGAVAGIESWCRDFAERQDLELDFTANVRNPLPPEIGVVLFRVLQEALQNTVKHSGAKRVQVELREESEALHLIVGDSGRGFDVEAAARGRGGLGLISMRERVRLLNGRISISSKPNGGTAIEARVPFEAGKAFELEKKISRSSN